MKKMMIKIGLFFFRVIIKFVPRISLKKEPSSALEEINKVYMKNDIWKKNDFYSDINNRLEIFDLSIIVAAYNVEKYIGDCIESLVNQKTNFNYEIIVIDDGSTDGTRDILSKYKDKYEKIKVLFQENMGASSARNLGIGKAEGKYIGFVDSDDYVDELYVETLLEEAIDKGADMVKTGFLEVECDSKKKIGAIKFEDEIIDMKINRESAQKIKGHAAGSIIKKALFKFVRFPVGYWYDDMIIKLLIVPQCNKIVTINKILYYYRINPNGLSKKRIKSYKYLDQFFLLEQVLEIYTNIGLPEDAFLYKQILHELGPVLWLRTRIIDTRIKKSIFILACNLKEKYSNRNYKLKYTQLLVEKSLEHKNWILWNLISIYSMIEIKFLENGGRLYGG